MLYFFNLLTSYYNKIIQTLKDLNGLHKMGAHFSHNYYAPQYIESCDIEPLNYIINHQNYQNHNYQKNQQDKRNYPHLIAPP